MNPLEEIVRVLAELLETRQRMTQLIDERDDALVALVESGVPVRQVPKVVRDGLVAAGWTEEAIDKVGVSYGNVQTAIRRRRRPPG